MRTLGLIAVMVCPGLAGCMIVPIPANPLPMAAAKRPAEALVLLPVPATDLVAENYAGHLFEKTKLTDTVDDTWKAEALAASFNATLDTIAAGKSNTLIGPKKQNEMLAPPPPDWGSLIEGVECADTEALAGLQEAAGKLKVRYLLRIRPRVTRYASGDGGGFPYGPPCVMGFWQGKVEITAELWDVSTGQAVSQCRAEDSFWGSVGNFPFILVGHAVFKTYGRACDQAVRQAIAEITADLRPHASP